MNNVTTYNIPINGLELQDAEDRAEEIQSFIYHAKNIFDAFAREEFQVETMRSVSVMGARSFEQLADCDMEQNVKF